MPGQPPLRWEIAAMIQALSQHPSLNTPAEAQRLEAAGAAMANWKSYGHACQARHNACPPEPNPPLTRTLRNGEPVASPHPLGAPQAQAFLGAA